MSYRGKKYSKQIRMLEKRNLLQEKAVSHIHNRGTGGTYRYHKRREKKQLLLEAAQREKEAARLLDQADILKKEAALYERWCREAAEELRKQAEALCTRAETLQNPEKPEKRVSVIPSGFPSADSCSKRTDSPLSTPKRSVTRSKPIMRRPVPVTPPVRNTYPQIASLAEAVPSGERNFMNGTSYRINPLDTLKMISASSVFGEPQYYRNGENKGASILDGTYQEDRLFLQYSLAMMDPFRGMTTSAVMEKAIDDALTADFEGALNWAVELRSRYLMRLNPQIILVRAAIHPGRQAFTKAHPGKFTEIAQAVMQRGDDVTNQVQYWLSLYDSKQKIPAILKRSWARQIGSMNAYSMAKYANTGIGLIDIVRICHAKGELVDQLMRTGRVLMPEGENTWERLRAAGKGWKEILSEIRMPHMALLRNLRGIFSEVRDPKTGEEVLDLLKRGVRRGKQFPFRYLSAWKAVKAEGRSWSGQVQTALETCMNISCENLPSLQGRCAFLTDNSGSAWGLCTSEWGTMKVAEIGNLSSTIGAMCADEGIIFPFGDRLESVRVHKEDGVLKQAHQVSAVGKNCGMRTENGIWLFFRDAILQKQHWDNIFIYSDMQAGHGGLYGIHPEDYQALGACVNGFYIDVNMLINLYRQQVNSKVNVFCIQTAGYTNVLVPEYGYRTAILYGWTGKELIFADALNRTWDELEAREPEKQ